MEVLLTCKYYQMMMNDTLFDVDNIVHVVAVAAAVVVVAVVVIVQQWVTKVFS